MTEFDFEIVYKKGSEMPADYLSHNFIEAISLDELSIRAKQEKEPDYVALKAFLLNGTPHPNPASPRTASYKATSSGAASRGRTNRVGFYSCYLPP